jgi:hypothetical protein
VTVRTQLASIARKIGGGLPGRTVSTPLAVADGYEEHVPDALLWVKDAPLFIDDENLGRFYDAVVRPAFKENVPFKLKISEGQKKDLQAKLGGKGKLGLAPWLSSILNAEVEVSAEGQVSKGSTFGFEQEVTFEPISTPQRQLVQLMVFYALNQPARLMVGGIEGPLEWQRSGGIAAVPRGLAFIDLPRGTKFIPMAAEFSNGKVVTLFDKLPGSANAQPPAFEREKKQAYWEWYAANFDPARSVEVIESASAANGKIEWIDFRVPLNSQAEMMHVHLEARGRYFTGALAYMIVRRSLGHGLRLVGTLKDGPDINVMALYEK